MKVSTMASLTHAFSAAAVAVPLLLFAPPAAAQVPVPPVLPQSTGFPNAAYSWMGPIPLNAHGVAPVGIGGSYWLLTGNPLAEGGYGTSYVTMAQAGEPHIEVIQVDQYISGMLPGTGVGAYGLSVRADGAPFVVWPRSLGGFQAVVSDEPVFEGGYSFYGYGTALGSLPTSMSVAAGEPISGTYQNDLWIVVNGKTYLYTGGAGGGGNFMQSVNQVANPVKIALFNETISCGGGDPAILHQPFLFTQNNTVYRYEFTQSVSQPGGGTCTPAPNSGCEYGCWQEISGLLTDITGDNFALGDPAVNSPVFQWQDASSSWVVVYPTPVTPAGANLVGIGAAPGYSSLGGGTTNLAAYDSAGNVYIMCNQLYGQCGGTSNGQPWSGPTCCAYTQFNANQMQHVNTPQWVQPTQLSYTSGDGSHCQVVNPQYSQCVPD